MKKTEKLENVVNTLNQFLGFETTQVHNSELRIAKFENQLLRGKLDTTVALAPTRRSVELTKPSTKQSLG